MTGSKDHEGQYLYCVIRSSEPQQFSTLGIGERGDIVHTVHYEDLAAVVSDSPIVEYDNTRRNMMAHTVVLEEVLQRFTILPVRYDTVAPDEKTVREKLLKRRFGELTMLLRDMDGLVELGLKALWYEGIVFGEILAENPGIRELRDKLVRRPAEETYYERMSLGEKVEAAMNRKRVADSEYILSRLRPLVRTTRKNPEITDRMVLNAAFLLEKEHQADFDAVIQALDGEMGKRLIFKYVGPVPPYNFVSIVIRWDEE